MSDNMELSRRKILGGVGAVGAAGAAAGLGTTALFSDEESFTNNSITAGTLDMKVDWEEHYSFPQLYGFADPEDGLTTTRSDPSSLTNPVAFPPGVEADPDSDPILWVEGEEGDSDVDAYMDNTSIEAFPDTNNDGIQDFDVGDPPENICEMLTDVGLDEDGLSADDRTTNEATSDGDPLINLQDVKPGDFGEVTFSFHLCDNPGYVWLNAANVTAAENGTNEPEANESSDSGPADEMTDSPADGDDIEILDEIQTAWWYDKNCDNLTDGATTAEGEAADVVIVMDVSGSMRGSALDNAKSGAQAMVDALGPNDQVALVSFAEDTDTPTDSSALEQGLTTDKSTLLGSSGAIENLSAGGGTNMEAGVERAHEELLSANTFTEYGESGNARSNARKIMVVLGDGSPNDGTGVTDSESNEDPSEEATNAKNEGIELFTIAYGSGGPVGLLDDMASDPGSNPEDKYAFVSSSTDIVSDFEEIAGDVGSGGEEIFYQDSLRNALQLLTSGEGIPLDGNGGDDFDEASDPPDADSRGCFRPTPETNCIGFSWWVPTDVGNQIQSDSVSFDLGFTAIQCRNSNGSFANAPDLQ